MKVFQGLISLGGPTVPYGHEEELPKPEESPYIPRHGLPPSVSLSRLVIVTGQISGLKLKVVEPARVKKVRMSADAMLQALLGGKHKVTMDLRANLKQVKKEVKEEVVEAVGEWRQNMEDEAGRKKMFETS